MNWLKKTLRNPYFYTFLLGFYGVWLIWDWIRLPYHGPAGIISYLPQIGYNPSNNLLRFLLAIWVPPLLCLALWLFLHTDWWARLQRLRASRYALPGLLITSCVLLCVGMGIGVSSTSPANNPVDVYGGPYDQALLDTFHEGETLGPAISYQQPDLKPYRDFVVVHGVFQDPLRTVIAFKLFGQSIGAARAFAVILTILTFLAYFGLLLILFRGHLLKSVAGLVALALLILAHVTLPWLGTHLYGIQMPFRDIATILFLMAAVVGLRTAQQATRPRLLGGMSLAIGFIVVAGFANSIDRAFYITALAAVWLVLVALVSKPGQFWKPVGLPFGIGLLLGIPVLGLALKWAFGDFLQYLFTMSRFKEYLDGMAFIRPDVAVSAVLLTVAALLTIFGARLLAAFRTTKSKTKVRDWRSLLQQLRAVLAPLARQYGIIILLFFTALFFLRSAIGRAVPDHFIYSVQWLYLLLVYWGIEYGYQVFKKQRAILGFMVVIVLLFGLAFYTGLTKKIDLARDTFPIHTPDKKFMRTDHIQTANWLKNNLHGNEQFMTLTSEGAWYYFVNKPSPSQYPIIWYAFTQPQREVIARELSTKQNIKYVLTNNNWTSNFDFVPNETRFPEVYNVLKERYVPYKGFGQQTIWIRK